MLIGPFAFFRRVPAKPQCEHAYRSACRHLYSTHEAADDIGRSEFPGYRQNHQPQKTQHAPWEG